MAQDCSTTKKNTGRPDCEANYGFVQGVILSPRGTQIATKTLVQTEATWTALFNAALSGRSFPINPSLNYLQAIEPTNDDPVFEEGLNGAQFKVRDGNRRFKFVFGNIPDSWKDGPRSLENSLWDAWLIMSNDYIRSYTPDGTKRQGFKAKVHGGNTTFAANSNEIEKYTFYVDILDPSKMGDLAVADECTETTGDFFATDLDGLIDCDITVVSQTTAQVIIDVKTENGETGVPDLVTADFVILNSAGAEVSLTAAESATIPGRYTLTATLTAGTYSVNLRNQPAMTTKGYESNAAVSFTTS